MNPPHDRSRLRSRSATLLALLLTCARPAGAQCDSGPDLVPHQPLLSFDDTAGVPVDLFALDIRSAGDVDADGARDLLVLSAASGPDMLASVHSMVDGRVLFSWPTHGSAFPAGSQIAAAGDLDGDGFGDVLVGDPTLDTVSVLGGPDGRLIATLAGDQPGDAFGFSVASAGDVDGDGVPDVLVGAPQSALQRPGYARLYSGAGGQPLHTWLGRHVGVQFGRAVDGAGDVDGDGAPDLVVGAPADGNTVLSPGLPPFVPPFRRSDGAGSVSVFSGADGSRLLLAFGDLQGLDQEPRGLGAQVRGVGDLNGDGFADVAAATSLHGDLIGTVPPAYMRTWSGAAAGPLEGLTLPFFHTTNLSLGAAGDLDGDGLDDLLLGTPTLDPGVTGAGVVLAFSGRDGSELFSAACLGITANVIRVSVDGLSDLDGDGLDDFAAGVSEAVIGLGEVLRFSSR